MKGLCLFAHNVYSDGDRNIAKRIWSYIFTRRFQWHCVFVNSLLLQLFTCLACLRSLLLWRRCYIVNQSFCSGGYLLCILPIDHIRILSIGLELACNGGLCMGIQLEVKCMITAFDLKQSGKGPPKLLRRHFSSHDGVIWVLPILFYLFCDPQLVRTMPASLCELKCLPQKDYFWNA